MGDFNCNNCNSTGYFCQNHWHQYCDIKKKFKNFDALCKLVVSILNEHPETEENFKEFTRFEKKDVKFAAREHVLDKSKYVKKIKSLIKVILLKIISVSSSLK